MKTMRSKAAETIGVDSTDGAFRVVGMARGSITFTESGANIPPALAGRLADGSRCSVAAAPASCLLFALQPPDLPEPKLVRILPLLLDVQLPIPLAECQYAFTCEGKTWRAHAIRQSDLARQLDSLRQAGCNPDRVVPPATAAWSQALVECPPQTDNEPRALFLCGSAQTVLVTGRGRTLERQTVFKTEAAELLRRLRLSFSGLPDNLVCLVAGAGHALAAQAFHEMIRDGSIHLETVRSPEFFLARALAADAARVDRWNDANLLTGTFTHPATIRRQSRPLVRLAAALSVCAAILLTLAGMVAARARTEARNAERAFDRAVDALAGYDVKTKSERAIQDARDGLSGQLDTTVFDYRNRAVSSRLAHVADRAIQADVTLHHLDLDARALTASGTATTTDKAEAFIRLLNTAGFRVVMAETPKAASDGTVQFFLHTPQP